MLENLPSILDLAARGLYLLGAAWGFALMATSALPAAFFWGIGGGLALALALVDSAILLALPGLAGLTPSLQFYNATIGAMALGLGALFSIVVPPASKRRTLFTALGIALLMAAAVERLPLGQLPMPLVLLGMLMLAVLIGLRHRPAPARWLLAGMLLLGLAELTRHGFLPGLPLPEAEAARLLLGLGLYTFGRAAKAA
ncbi:hypothetical protein [Ferrovibrio sp.]|uniref:hypothetical protein n=1 Tax=Ferrovibrio sp. TaxID=1917215 RepID=UPI0025B9E0D7|nr:hypothetical protein [Ferrovibrio sp.]MBX3456567.1 hypothetical protein [Ferrovibrio sp.]